MYGIYNIYDETGIVHQDDFTIVEFDIEDEIVETQAALLIEGLGGGNAGYVIEEVPVNMSGIPIDNDECLAIDIRHMGYDYFINNVARICKFIATDIGRKVYSPDFIRGMILLGVRFFGKTEKQIHTDIRACIMLNDTFGG